MVTRHKKKRAPKAAKKKRKKIDNLNVTDLQIKNLARKYKTIAAADEACVISLPLAEVFKRKSRLITVWDKALVVNTLEYCASVSMSKLQTALKLGFKEASELEALLESDIEARDIWAHSRLMAVIASKDALTVAAHAGNQAAIKAIARFLEDESPELDEGDYYQVGREKIAEMLGVQPKAITIWKQQEGMPCLPGNKYSIPVCVKWAIERAVNKVRSKVITISPLTQAKIEEKKISNQKLRGELLDRKAVVQRFTSIYQAILSEWTRLVRDLAPVLANKTDTHISQILSKERANFVARLRDVPRELQLGQEAKAAYMEFFDVLDKEFMDDTG